MGLDPRRPKAGLMCAGMRRAGGEGEGKGKPQGELLGWDSSFLLTVKTRAWCVLSHTVPPAAPLDIVSCSPGAALPLQLPCCPQNTGQRRGVGFTPLGLVSFFACISFLPAFTVALPDPCTAPHFSPV